MDALGNLMLGLWFMILTGACSGMAFLIFKDHRPVRRDKLGYKRTDRAKLIVLSVL